MKTKYLLVFGIIFLILPMFASLASALTDNDALFKVKQFETYDIKRPCTYNGSVCSSAATCNMSIVYLQGNGTAVRNYTVMTNQIVFHNITLQSSDTRLLGWHQVYVTCYDQGDSGSEVFFYEVTPTGDENPMGTFIIIGTIFIIFLIFGFAVKNEYIVFISGMIALITGIYSMKNGFNSAPNDFTYMLSTVILGIGIIFIIMPAYQLLSQDGDTGYEEVEDIVSE